MNPIYILNARTKSLPYIFLFLESVKLKYRDVTTSISPRL